MADKPSREPKNNRSLSETFHEKSEVDSFGRNIRLFLPMVFLLLLVGGSLALIPPADIDTPTDSGVDAPHTITISDANYTTVYDNVAPSVVSVYTTNENSATSQGSGFVYDNNGHIVTNWHVINESEDIEVRYHNGDWGEAELVGSDPYTDLAVLKVDQRPDAATPLPVTDNTPRVGARVLALGSPDNLQGSLSTGTVSGLNRSMTTPQGFVVPDMVQTDAALNPGNSGGPLVGMDETVQGVNRARQGENLGFAISGRVVHSIVPSLIENGEYHHSLVGIKGTTVDPTVADANDIETQSGVLITEVVDDGPSDGALQGGSGERIEHNGVEMYDGGDLIIAVDGHTLNSNEALTSYLIRETQPGDTIEFTIIRNGEQTDVTVTLGERPVYGE